MNATNQGSVAVGRRPAWRLGIGVILRTLAASTLAAGALAGCGQKGPLTLPGATPTTSAASGVAK